MDAALRLRMLVDSGAPLQEGEADALLARSDLVQQLAAERVDGALPCVWRLTALAEIPFAERLPFTRELAERTISTLGTAHGFSLTGRADDLLPCYNAMLVRALTRLGFAARPEVAAAVGWILQHQPLDRSWRTSWSGHGIHKYGGCL